MHRMTRKLLVLPFVLSAVFVDFEGCWRPITGALDQMGIGVHTYGDELSVSFWDGHHSDED